MKPVLKELRLLCFINNRNYLVILKLKFIYSPFLLLFVFVIAFAAISNAQDKKEVSIQSPLDTLKPRMMDSVFVASDTSKKKSDDVDSVIYTSGSDSLIFFVKQKKMNVYGSAALKYKTTDLKSERIFIDFPTNYIEAIGLPDSLNKKGKGHPVLTEGSEKYEGERMKYNFKTQRAFITFAGTKSEGTAYSGIKIKKMDKDTYFVKNGVYTTCDADTPHYCFYGSEMKVIQKDEIIGRWIWLTFGGVPFPIPIPFAVFPIQSGRRSGIIAPTFGESANQGMYFSHFGYYWATNDYMDINMTGTYYLRGGFAANSHFNYAKRYDLNGYVDLGYSNLHTGESSDFDRTESKDWSIYWHHNQTIDPTTSFNTDVHFLTKNYLGNNSKNINELLDQDIYSNITFSKTWDEAGENLNVNYNRTQNLKSGSIAEVLPSITFSKTQFFPFKNNSSSESSSTSTTFPKEKWYELIGISYNGSLLNRRNTTDSTLNIRGAISHSLSTSISPKVGYFTISPNVSYNEFWYNKQVTKHLVASTVKTVDSRDSVIYTEKTDDVNKISMLRTFDVGVSASTKFFGMFTPPIPGVVGIRHTVTPSISYQYAPDFSKDVWGYYGYYLDQNGKKVMYSKYEKEILGSVPTSETQMISLNVGNNIEMKIAADPTDTTSKEKKIQLLNFTMNMSYNFANKKLSDLYLNYYTKIGELFNLQGSSTFSPYGYNSSGPTNEYLWDTKKKFLYLTNSNLNISTSISGEKLKSADDKDKDKNTSTDETSQSDIKTTKTYSGLNEQKDADFSIPWDVNLGYTFAYAKQYAKTSSTSPYTSSINANLNFNLTPAWKITFQGYYNFIDKQFSSPVFTISRDLHCWLMNFTWTPIGSYRGYSFELKVKAPQLQDLKITKRDQFYDGK